MAAQQLPQMTEAERQQQIADIKHALSQIEALKESRRRQAESARAEQERLATDPLFWVMQKFPWGQIGQLLNETGPDEWQHEILVMIRSGLLSAAGAIRLAVASGHGVGKLQSYDDIVPTPSGPRRWGDLAVGDAVFGADGAATVIRWCTHYRGVPMYRVTFDDGSSAEVSSGHLWMVRGRQERRNRQTTWRTLETIDILRRGVKRPNGGAVARQWEIPVQRPAQFDAIELPVHPYVMGVWLGDGSRTIPQYTKPYPEVATRIESFGYEVSRHADGTTHRIIGVSDVFRGGVFDCGSAARFIPDIFKFNTVENRMELFRGLCDTDGETHHCGSIGYSSTSRQLAEDMIWLARSLGCKAQLQRTPKKGRYRKGDVVVECRDCYRVTINAPFNPFTVEHKRSAYKPSEARYLARWIDSIEPTRGADGMCITVEAQDGLYQANDFIVTHNSAMVAWLILWSLDTMEDTRGVVTANTEVQLRTKTWAELAKWYGMMQGRELFELGATAIFAKLRPRTWRIDAVPWSEKNTEAFAGLHNAGKRIMLLFDEASSIPNVIWEVAQGALTDADTQILWLAFGNPTQNTGRFRECWSKYQHRWIRRQIDSRSCKKTNKAEIQQWVEDEGEDSDYVRVRVRGVFPRFGSQQFIPSDVAENAGKRPEVASTLSDPCIMGVDVGRFGDDPSVIYIRRGRDGRLVKPIRLYQKDNMLVAARVVEEAERHAVDTIFVDGGGPGGGVIDRLRMLRQPVVEVQFGGSPTGGTETHSGQMIYANKRAEMWGLMRDWLAGGCIPHDPTLFDELTGVEYSYVLRSAKDALLLEKKEDMRKRGLPSPNTADALALTFAFPVAPSDHRARMYGDRKPGLQSEYDPFAEMYKMDMPGGYR